MKTQLIVGMVLVLAMLANPVSGAGGCGKWVVRDNTDYLEDPIFDSAVASSTGSSATVNPDGTAKTNNETKEKNEQDTTNKIAATVNKAPSIDLAGKWKVMLEKGSAEKDTGRALDLILIQTGDRLQGYGTLLGEGADIPATATGTVSSDSVSLDVKLTKQKKDYRLDLALIDSKLKGDYQLYESDELAENGNATASRSAP